MSAASAAFYSGRHPLQQQVLAAYQVPCVESTASMVVQAALNLHRGSSPAKVAYANRYRGEAMKTANGQITRTNAEHDTRWLNDVPAIKARVADAIEKDHGHKHSHLKLIAGQTGASPRTVEKWKDAQYLPGLEHFLRLYAKSPSLQKMLDEIRTFDPDTDPRYGRVLMDLQREARR